MFPALEEFMTKRDATTTERQEKWFKSVEEGVLRESGRTVEEWVGEAQKCPETSHSARLKWMKEEFGLGANRASLILGKAFPDKLGWNDPDALLAALWTDPRSREIYDAVEDFVETFDDVTVGPRKAFVGFSAELQFAAAKPTKTGAVRLGLAVPTDFSERLMAVKASEGWSDRLKSVIELNAIADLDDEVKRMLRAAHDAST